MSSSLRLICDLGPLAVFFVAYRFFGLMPATGALIAATLLALAVTYAKERKVALMPLITALMVSVFGGLSIYLNDEYFIKVKPTIINTMFAAVLLGGVLCGKPLLKYVFASALTLEEKGWMILSRRWGLFFLFLAGLNEYIWRHFPTEFWVNFKVFGMFTLTLFFTLSQLPLMQRYIVESNQ